jgi:hypothetical protein
MTADPLDTDYLITHAREQQAEAERRQMFGGSDRCKRCGCSWHGLRCAVARCLCLSSWEEP